MYDKVLSTYLLTDSMLDLLKVKNRHKCWTAMSTLKRQVTWWQLTNQSLAFITVQSVPKLNSTCHNKKSMTRLLHSRCRSQEISSPTITFKKITNNRLIGLEICQHQREKRRKYDTNHGKLVSWESLWLSWVEMT